MKILAVGDIHLGRTPSRLPSELEERAKQLGPAEAWRRAVDAALEQGVRAVLLAGDVVEREEDFFEALRELSRGVERLARNGVDVIGVAGNHDVKVLPQLAKEIPRFRLLGAGGEWQCLEIAQGDESLTLWGWSFPQRQVAANPLPASPFERKPGLNLGLLHCDRDGGSSHYAPVGSRDLDRAGLDGWLLGHIHKPDNLTKETLSGYLGSLSGLDAGEPGPHGPWIIEVSGGRVAHVEQMPIAPLRFEALSVDLGGSGQAAEVKSRLLEEIRRLDARLALHPSGPDAVGLRVEFVGRTRLGGAAEREVPLEDRGDIYSGSTNRHYFIERLRVRTRPEIDLRELAERPDPLGVLAERLLWLEQTEDVTERGRLVNRARERLASAARQPVWAALMDDEPTALDAEQWLRDAGYRALDQLLAQKEGEA